MADLFDIAIAEKLAGGGGGGSWTVLTEETVTTTMEEGDTEAYGNLSYSQRINDDSITVTFDGVEYECPRTVYGDGSNGYGAPYDESTSLYDWSEYPFGIASTEHGNIIITETAGTYTVKIEAPQSGSSDFSTAEVTIVNNWANASTWGVPYFIDSPVATSIAALYVPTNSETTKQMILYKGMGIVTTESAFSDIQITGSAELSEEGIFVTGDCTITIS